MEKVYVWLFGCDCDIFYPFGNLNMSNISSMSKDNEAEITKAISLANYFYAL